MIEELSVRNFALIDSLTLPLEDGFTVLTGETGAGKSIIVGSLSFLLGGKADSEVIRSGTDEASVSAIVSVNSGNRDALEWLRQRDIETDDSRLVVRRAVKSSGRNSIYIQNVPVTRNDLAEFMGLLFDLHGQHSHESLIRKETHRVYLDGFSGLEDEAMSFNRVFAALAEKRKSLEALNRSEQDRERQLELLAFGVEEITKSAPKSGEIKELEAETQRLGDFEKLSLHVNTAASALFDDEASLLSLTRRLRAALENAASIDNSLSPVLKRLEDLFYEAEDLAAEFRDYRDRLSYDPARLEEAEERLSLLYKLKKKYRPSQQVESGGRPLSDEEGILAYKTEAMAEIETLSGAVENREKLKAEISRLEKDIAVRASALSEKRKKGAVRLSTGITEILSKLGMPKAVFSTQVLQKPGQGLVCGPWGADDVEFMISANTGEPARELARIASGGELSRVMLAIKTILCGTDSGERVSAETLVFDEIDTGIGGEVALSVGEYLSRIGKGKQIFCVTHLATIAVRADNHLRVEKRIITGSVGTEGREVERTVTSVSVLKSHERRQEIARMLAGDSGKTALAHADELLKKYGVVQ
jgi:DNA repair protein RecN (Recombination protein N)